LRANVLSMAAGVIEAWWQRLPGFWRAQTTGWGLFTIVELVDRRLIYHSLPISLFLTVLVAPCLILLSTCMAAVFASRSFDNRLTPRALVLVALFSFGAASIVVGTVFIIRQASGWTIPDWDPIEEVLVPLIQYFVVFVGWSVCYFWIHAEIGKRSEHHRAMLAEADALRAELQRLRLQLDPHFLFNALNGVAEEIPEHPSAALAMLRDLTAYLRHSLAGINQTVVTVEAEVEGLAAYLRVQKARFGARLRTRLHMDRGVASHRIASFLLQPLVENAVKHGSRENGLDVGIDIRSAGEALRIEIENAGTLDDASGARRRGAGIGLENMRQRLALHYPDRHHFTLRQHRASAEMDCKDSRVIATLVLEGEPCSGS
jgi:two-component system LytT family sensor kinase